MRINSIGDSGRSVSITLSYSNLLALLAKLDGRPHDSANTIVRWQPEAPFKPDAPGFISVTAEPDNVHYAERNRGRMHPDTESAMSVNDMREHGSRAQ